MTDSDIIDALGGTCAVARLCQIQPASVSEWRKEGIPSARRQFLELLHPEAFGLEPRKTPAKRRPSRSREEAA